MKVEVLTREMEKLERDDHKEVGQTLIQQIDEVRELMPENMRRQVGRLILRALVYCREKLTYPVYPESFVQTVLHAAEFGLAIDGRLAHAVPFRVKKSEVRRLVFVPDYKGMIAVSKWRGVLKDAYARVVKVKDDFRMWEDESGNHYRYEQYLKGERGPAIGAYCLLHFPDDRRRIEFMDEEEIRKIRAIAKSQDFWNAWEDEMRKKCPVRRAMKLCQDDPQISDLLEADNAMYDNVIDVTKPLDLEEDTKQFAASAPQRSPQATPTSQQAKDSSPAQSKRRRRRAPGAPPSETKDEPASPALIEVYQRGWKALHEEGEDPVQSMGWEYEFDPILGAKEVNRRIQVFVEKVKAVRKQKGAANASEGRLSEGTGVDGTDCQVEGDQSAC